MKLLIAGACGFVGSTIARHLLEWGASADGGMEIFGIDNFSRQGSEVNRLMLQRLGLKLLHGDLRCPSDLEQIPHVDWVLDASANPSVMAGVDGRTSSRQLMDHNLSTTINLLEYCKVSRAGFILLSTSRVYSIHALANLPLKVEGSAFKIDTDDVLPIGVSSHGVSEEFSTEPPLSLYGVSKLASEAIALEYGAAFDLPIWINRCGVLAGAGQFGRPDQGIFSFWIHSYLRRRPLKYLGFGGHGHQVRDGMHPRDLVSLLVKQFNHSGPTSDRLFNFGGGRSSSISLAQLTDWCRERFGDNTVESDPQDRPFDVPWMVMDSRKGEAFWSWKPETNILDILTEIAEHAEKNPEWLERSGYPNLQ